MVIAVLHEIHRGREALRVQRNFAVTGNDANNTLSGGPGNDVLYGGAGNDAITGSAGKDVIVGGSGSDTLKGGVGDDVFLVTGSDAGYDRFEGGDGYDVVSFSGSGAVSASLTGIDGIAHINGWEFNVSQPVSFFTRAAAALSAGRSVLSIVIANRDRESMEYAITFAGTGHLCLATLHANNAAETLDRIINMFPRDQHSQVFLDLSQYLKAIVSQRLVPRADGQGRVAAIDPVRRTAMAGRGPEVVPGDGARRIVAATMTETGAEEAE